MLDLSSFAARNAEALQRLRATVARLREADYARSIGHGWTVGAALAHVAYWDRLTLARLIDWEKAGPAGVQAVHSPVDSINDGMLAIWLGTTPNQVAADVTEAAEAVDGVVARLSPELAQAIFAVSPRSLDRSLHRGEHLDEVERALGEATDV